MKVDGAEEARRRVEARGRSSWEGFKQSDLAGLHLFFYFLYIDV